MEIVLAVLGAAILIVGIAVGIDTHSFFGFLVPFVNAAAVSAVLFGLIKVLENQDEISARLAKLNDLTQNPPENIICAKCGTSYKSSDFSYCPHCGAKQEEKAK